MLGSVVVTGGFIDIFLEVYDGGGEIASPQYANTSLAGLPELISLTTASC